MKGITRMLAWRAMLSLAAGSLVALGTAGAASAATTPTNTLTLSQTAPSTATVGNPFEYTLKVGNKGPTQATATTVTDQLPANTTLIGFNHSQGTCSSAGSPAKVTCDLGNLASGATATVTVVVKVTKAGSVTNSPTATDTEGSTASATATTTVSAPPAAGTKPQATTGGSSSVRNTSAKLAGTVVPGNQHTGYFFEVGTSKSYGMFTPVAYTGTSKASVSSIINRLAQATTYHYRLVAINDSGTSYGADKTFRTTGSRYLGSLVLRSTRLHVRNGKVYVPFTCNSAKTCVFRFTIVIRARTAKTKKLATIVVTRNQNGIKRIGAHRTVTEAVGVKSGALAILKRARHHRTTAKLTSRPRTNQRGLIRPVTLIYG